MGDNMGEYLYTERLRIRSVSEDDALMLSRWKSMFKLREMSVGLDTKITENNQRNDIRNTFISGDMYVILELKEDFIPIGYIRLGWMDDEHERCWLSYGMVSHYREGYCYEALNTIIPALYRFNMVNKIEAEVFEFNEASRRLLEKLGFARNGKRLNDYYYKNKYWDILKYEMTKERMDMILEQKIKKS